MNAKELKKIVVPGDEIRRKCWTDNIFILIVNDSCTLDGGPYESYIKGLFFEDLPGDDWEVVKIHYIKEAFNANVLGGKYYHDCEKSDATHILKPFNKG